MLWAVTLWAQSKLQLKLTCIGMPVRTVILNWLRIHPAKLGKMTSFTLSISIHSSRNMKPRSHFCGLTSIESPMKRDVIFDQNFPSYYSIDFNQTTTEKRTWYKSWFPFDLKRDPMSKMAVIHNCFTVKLSITPFIRHSTKLWTARAINNIEHRSEARVVAARKAFWVKGNERVKWR